MPHALISRIQLGKLAGEPFALFGLFDNASPNG
jgi:hypothetical protein